MSSRRRGRQQSSSSSSTRISDDQIVDLVTSLRQLLPEIQQRSRYNKVSASKVLEDTCSYIRSLNKQVEDLSDRLSQLLATIDSDSPEAAIIRSLIA